MGVSRSELIVDLSMAGAPNASLTPSKSPYSSVLEVLLLAVLEVTKAKPLTEEAAMAKTQEER